MKLVSAGLTFLALLSLVGCSTQNAELEKARAEVEAAKAELADANAEAEAAKAELAKLQAQLRPKPDKTPTEDMVLKAAREFFKDLRREKWYLRSAYDRMSVNYRKGADLKAFEKFLEMNPAVTRKWSETKPRVSAVGPPAGSVPISDHRVTKLANDNAYEIDCLMANSSQIVLRLIHEEGKWKIDNFVEIKDKEQ